jgi:hypothetical protein
VPAELHADIVRELLTGPQLPYLPPEPAVESTAVDPLPPAVAERGESRD